MPPPTPSVGNLDRTSRLFTEHRRHLVGAARYRPRRPSQTVLYRCVPQHLEMWLARCRHGHDDEWSVPEHVEREYRRYLECGILAHGFARARCGQCGHDIPIAFPARARRVPPRATPGAWWRPPHLNDHVLPDLPLRQWVLAVPKAQQPVATKHPRLTRPTGANSRGLVRLK